MRVLRLLRLLRLVKLLKYAARLTGLVRRSFEDVVVCPQCSFEHIAPFVSQDALVCLHP